MEVLPGYYNYFEIKNIAPFIVASSIVILSGLIYINKWKLWMALIDDNFRVAN